MPAANGSDGSSTLGPPAPISTGSSSVRTNSASTTSSASSTPTAASRAAVERPEPGLEDVAREPRAGRCIGVDALQRLGDVLGRRHVPEVVAERVLGRRVVDARRVAVVEDREHRERDRVGRQLVVRDVVVLVGRRLSDRDRAGHHRRDIGADQPVALQPAGVLGTRVGRQDAPDDARARGRVDPGAGQENRELVGLHEVDLGQVAAGILGGPQRIVPDEDLGDPVA